MLLKLLEQASAPPLASQQRWTKMSHIMNFLATEKIFTFQPKDNAFSAITTDNFSLKHFCRTHILTYFPSLAWPLSSNELPPPRRLLEQRKVPQINSPHLPLSSPSPRQITLRRRSASLPSPSPSSQQESFERKQIKF